MSKIGIFFGTETGTTRLVAKKIQRRLGDTVAAKPINVAKATMADLMQYDALILGTPSYGVGDIPGRSAGCFEPNWEEFFARLDEEPDMRGKRVALFGLGAQERYAERFASSLFALYVMFKSFKAQIVCPWSTEGYQFEQSNAVVDGQFVGLVIDQRTQHMLTDERIDRWADQVVPLSLEPATA
jgi:flavodoxin I